jgi:hypothetical protein
MITKISSAMTINRNILYVVIAALAIATVVFGYQLYQGGRRPQASRSMLAKAEFPSSKSNFASGAVSPEATAIYLRFF